MASLIHLVRHGEVDNPGEVVYAALPGYKLSERGRRQAKETARYLGSRPLVAVWSSPLERALETAATIGDRLGVPVKIEEDLIEWRMADGWAGIRWDNLPEERPGELEAYLNTPHDLSFASESLTELANRVGGAIERIHRRHPEGDVAVVGHQDPIQAARLSLTGGDLARFHHDKPRHASVITLRPGTPWREEAAWSPAEQDLPSPSSPQAVKELGVGGEGEDG